MCFIKLKEARDEAKETEELHLKTENRNEISFDSVNEPESVPYNKEQNSKKFKKYIFFK